MAKNNSKYGNQRYWVFTDSIKGWVDVDLTEFVDIAEGPYGDIMTFDFEGCQYESQVVCGGKPS